MEKIKKIIKTFSEGSPVIVFDNESRENEADIIVAIDKVTPEQVNSIISEAKGLLCAALSEEIIKQKGFPMMPTLRNDAYSTAFTLSVDSKKCRTGISAYERYVTAKDLLDPSKTISDFITPGHLFPLAAKTGGLLARNGHTEAAVDLCDWAGLTKAALICEMIKPDGSMYSREDAEEFGKKNNIPFCSVEELIQYSKSISPNVEKVVSAALKSEYGIFDISVYKELFSDKEHLFLSMGDFTSGPVRIHSECLTGDVFHSKSCDCQNQLDNALRLIAKEGKGAVVYLRQEGRGIGLGEKIKAYKLQQEKGMDTIEANLHLGHKADNRDFHQAAWILKDQGFKDTIKLVTNNPEKIKGVEAHGLTVEKVKVKAHVKDENRSYLTTKREKMGHDLEF